jgi:hypothetical protein
MESLLLSEPDSPAKRVLNGNLEEDCGYTVLQNRKRSMMSIFVDLKKWRLSSHKLKK